MALGDAEATAGKGKGRSRCRCRCRCGRAEKDEAEEEAVSVQIILRPTGKGVAAIADGEADDYEIADYKDVHSHSFFWFVLL